MQNKIPAQTAATLAGLVAIFLWSTAVAFARSVSEQLGPLTAAAVIYFAGGTIGLGFQIFRADFRKDVRTFNRKYLLGCGSLFVIYMASLYLALGLASNRDQVLEVGLLNYLWPMLTLLLTVPLLKIRARIWLFPGAIIATLGAFLAMIQGQIFSWFAFQQNLLQNFTPYALGLTAAISWALYSVLSRKWGNRLKISGVFFFMLATGILLGTARLLFPENSIWSLPVTAELLYLIISTNLAYFFWELAMRKGDITLVVSCSYFTPLLSTIVSVIYLSVRAGTKIWIGAILVVVGAIICKKSIVSLYPEV